MTADLMQTDATAPISLNLLFLHNNYGVRSGEEIMLEKIVGLLSGKGHSIKSLIQEGIDSNAGIGVKTQAFFAGLYSKQSRASIGELILRDRPDLVQVQNLYPLLSPSILPVIGEAGIPIVMRVSNYRLICPTGLFYSHGEVCERCCGGHEYWCAIRNCESDILKSISYALRNAFARVRRYYIDNVSRYYAQTEFQKKALIEQGYPAGRVSVIPNMIDPGEEETAVGGDYVAFVGRLSPEKGVGALIDASRECRDIPFKLAGAVREGVVGKIPPPNAEFLGNVDRGAVAEIFRASRIVIVPSSCYEGFPNVILEAMRHKKPVVCSNIGGFPEIVDDGETGLLFEADNSDDLARKVRYLWERPELCKEMGEAGYRKVLREYTPDMYYKRLIRVYEKALHDH